MKKRLFNLLLVLIIIQILILIKIVINNIKEDKQREIEVKSINYVLNKKIETPTIIDDIIEYEIIIEIPKINLKKGILKKEDKDNNIDKNVTILEESKYPNEEGNIYIAAHSGNGNHSYFNDLVKLKLNDEVHLYYQNVKYTYQVNQIKNISKKTNSSILTNNQDNLILITCDQKNKTKYLIVILSKIKETELN